VRERRPLTAGESKRVLLVEDNPVNQKVALAMLRKYDLQIDTAGNGAEALQALSSISYDLVFMDVQMPVMDGIEAVKQIRSGSGVLNSKVPVIAMTAHAFDEDRQRCLDAGMDDFLSKPVIPGALAETLERWLGRTDDSPGAGRSESSERQNFTHAFNRTELLHRMMGDEDLMRGIIRTFIEDIPEQARLLREASRSDDFKDIERLSHTIKGACANLGAAKMRDAAFVVEQAARKQNRQIITAVLPDLEKELALLLEILNAEVE
jgi:two-component system, sensor histidine kinase and response regulator